MKALFLKDIYTLKESRVLLILILVVVFIMGMWGGIEETAGFIAGYISILATVLVANVIAYDEIDNGYAFLFTLPVSRKGYVLEKYVFGWTMGIASWLLALGVLTVITLLQNSEGTEASASDQWMTLATLFILLLMQALIIPIQLKFGGQKGKLFIVFIIAGVWGAVMALSQYSAMQGLLNRLAEASSLQLCASGIGAVLLLTAASLVCSMHIMEKKEF